MPVCREQTRIFPARYENLAAIDQFVAEAAECAGFDSCTVYQVQLAVDEACSNIIKHAYGGEGRGVIECSRRVQDGDLTVVLRDDGQPFDPESVPEPDIEANLEERAAGGLGLYFIRQIMDEVTFTFDSEAGNVLTLVKRQGHPDARA
jgi:serine/threonine-protein kinase RsbW